MGLPKPYYTDDYCTIYHGDCRDVMPGLSGVTAVVSDPPYGLAFMGKAWDHGVPGVEFWRLIAGACLPGAPMLAFGGTRTYHRLVCAIEDAGWEIRDCLQWIYGSGFPKSHNIANSIDKASGKPNRGRAIPAASTHFPSGKYATEKLTSNKVDPYEARTIDGRPWQGYGTALKPAHEPICLAMNPLDGTFAANALEHGVAGLNVDGGRVGTEERPHIERRNDKTLDGEVYGSGINGSRSLGTFHQGRWPANIIHDGSEEVLAGFPVTGKSQGGRSGHTAAYGGGYKQEHYGDDKPGFGDSGSAARFFYCAKASKAERNAGCEGLEERDKQTLGKYTAPSEGRTAPKCGSPQRNNHPTVKPLALMRYLCTLVTMPERNLILDPFAGSGTTGVACKQLGLPCILIEQDEHHCEIIAARIAAAKMDKITEPDPQQDLFCNANSKEPL